MALSGPMEQISESDLLAMVEDGERETRTLDVKRQLYGAGDQDKREMCADVTSFANTMGGHIVLGMDEDAGIAVAVDGVDLPDPDQEMLRMQQVLRSGTRPRLAGVEMHPVRLATGRFCLVIRIPRSTARPHAVANGDWLCWHARNSGGKYRLDVPEIRSAILLSESIADRMRAFRLDRVAAIEAGDTPAPLPDGPRIVYHLLPADAFDRGELADLATIAAATHPNNRLFGFAPFMRFNYDGLLFYEEAARDELLKRNAYVQVYDTGIIESAVVARLPRWQGDSAKIDGLHLEGSVINHVSQLLDAFRRMPDRLPVYLFVSMIGMRGQTICTNRLGTEGFDLSPVSRDPMHFADVVIDEADAKPEQILKPVFDRMWRASGWDGSPSYNADGEWDEPLRSKLWKGLL